MGVLKYYPAPRMIERYTRPQMGRLWSEETRLQLWLQVELLVLEAQARQGLVPRRALATIRRKARVSLARMRRFEARTQHDVIAFLEDVGASLGPEGRYLHAGLTSSDILDTALAVQLMQAADLLLTELRVLRRTLARQARRYRDTVMIGRTHGVHAEPTTFGLKLAVFYEEFGRHLERLQAARRTISVGKISGAVGTYASVAPSVERYVCRQLGLQPAPISTQIIQRDRHAHFVTTLALVGASLEKLATEIRHLQRTEVLEAEEPFGEGQKGSSAMPHKRNPIACERVTGLARLLRSYALAAMENVALWHERDISHSSVERVILPDATSALDYMLATMTRVITHLHVYPARMRENLALSRGLPFSGRVLVALMRAGVPRRQAYEWVQTCAMEAWRNRADFATVVQQHAQIRRHLSTQTLTRLFRVEEALKHRRQIFRRVGLS